MSSGWATRFRACMPRVRLRPDSVLAKLDMSVSTTPGATALTRMPRSPSADAKCVTSVATGPWWPHKPKVWRRKRVRAVRRSQIRGHLVGTAAGLANLRDDCLSLLRATGIVNEDLRPGLRQCKCAGAADAARGAGDEGGLS